MLKEAADLRGGGRGGAFVRILKSKSPELRGRLKDSFS